MKVVIAPDKFKDCLSAAEVAAAMAGGALAAPDVETPRAGMTDVNYGYVF